MIHGGDIYTFEALTGQKPLDFSENTNPLGLPSAVQTAITASVNQYSSYPDPNCRTLAQATAQYYNINAAHILFGNGAADLIFKIAYYLNSTPAVVLAPTFSEYELALKNAGSPVEHYHLSSADNFAVHDDIAIYATGKVVFICNPNNPTGQLCSISLLEKIAANAKLLIIDECFIDFVSPDSSFVTKFTQYPNVIILKAFTKIFAMAGIRLGFCICSNPSILSAINAQGQPWSVSTVAQVAGVACFEDPEYIRSSLALINTERKFLETELANLGFTVFKSVANYILFKTDIAIASQLMPHGIMIRDCSNYIGLDNSYYRIAVKTHEHNLQLLNALHSFIR